MSDNAETDSSHPKENNPPEPPKRLEHYCDAAIYEPHLPIFITNERSNITKEQLEDPNLEYDMTDRSRRGYCVIVNEEEFDRRRTEQLRRVGTDKDAENCENAFRHIGYQVKRYDNLSAQEIVDRIKEYANMDHTNFDSFVFIFLTHGDSEYIYGSDGKIKIGDIMANFKSNRCKSLLGKPKLFFIQACRGRDYNYSMSPYISYLYETSVIKKFPVEPDFLVSFSACPLSQAYHKETEGSWYIRNLSKVFLRYGNNLELNRLLTMINRFVAYDYEMHTPLMENGLRVKQMPAFISMLTKEINFR